MSIIKRKEARERSLVFFNDNLPVLGANATLTAQFAIIQTQLGVIETAMTEQAAKSGDASQAYQQKDTEREDLRAQMQPIARTARRMNGVIKGISEKYKMPYSRSDQVALNTANAWVADLPEVEAEFIDFAMPATFIADLAAAAAAFDATINPASDAVTDRVEATADIGESDRIGMQALRICDAIIRNIYAGDPGKLAAWLSASHVERG